jgi:hypothetical protein
MDLGMREPCLIESSCRKVVLSGPFHKWGADDAVAAAAAARALRSEEFRGLVDGVVDRCLEVIEYALAHPPSSIKGKASKSESMAIRYRSQSAADMLTVLLTTMGYTVSHTIPVKSLFKYVASIREEDSINFRRRLHESCVR